jgi:hypothetical protein
MGEFADTISRGGRMSVGLAERLLKDVSPEIFARKPSFGGKVIEANHAAFNFGHLATYPARWLEFVGLDPAPAAVPADFTELFGAGKPCHDDPTGKIYPPMKTIMDAFFAAHKAALDVIPALDDAKLRAPNPREGRMREMFPTIGGMMVFYINNHTMMHLGQVSTWRRCFGLGSVM